MLFWSRKEKVSLNPPALKKEVELVLTRQDRFNFYKLDVEKISLESNLAALVAKLAKCDGFVNEKEITAAKEYFSIDKDIFNEACSDNSEFFLNAKKLKLLFADSQEISINFLKMFDFAAADKPLNCSEIVFLNEVARVFEISREMLVGKLSQLMIPLGDDFYTLGLSNKRPSLTELNIAYKNAVEIYNDNKFKSISSIPEMNSILNYRLSSLNTAYKNLKKIAAL